MTVAVANTVTGATRGLSLIGGTGGTGNVSVTGTGGFVGGTGDAANILNNGNGTTIVNAAAWVVMGTLVLGCILIAEKGKLFGVGAEYVTPPGAALIE